MRKTIFTAIAATALALSGAAMAQTAAEPAGQPSVDWKIEDLLADPGAKAVIDKDLPGVEDDPRLDMVKTMTLRAVAQIPDAQIDDAKLAAIQADLAALPKKAS
jgi:hypothetical protein